MSKYEVMGRPGAGSLVVEFLLREVGADYVFTEVTREHSKSDAFLKLNPFARIPVLVCPDGTRIFESLAIIAHIVETFPAIAPPPGDPGRSLMWQHLAVFGTSLYVAMHRQHHTYYYAPESAFDEARALGARDGAVSYDYAEAALCPFLTGETPGPADFYLYMITRWEPDLKGAIRSRPKLAAFIKAMRAEESVDATLGAHKAALAG